MAVVVTQTSEARYIVVFSKPESIWIDILRDRLITDRPTAAAMAIGQGLIELMSRFGEPVVEHESKGHEKSDVEN